jgi:hypothetical protein
MGLIMTAIKSARVQKGYSFFGFRGDNRSVSVGTLLDTSSNGLGSFSIIGDSSKLPGVSSIGISNPKDSKSIILSWRAFVSVEYGKSKSLIGGRFAFSGDDVLTARMTGKDYEVKEVVIGGAEVLVVIRN